MSSIPNQSTGLGKRRQSFSRFSHHPSSTPSLSTSTTQHNQHNDSISYSRRSNALYNNESTVISAPQHNGLCSTQFNEQTGTDYSRILHQHIGYYQWLDKTFKQRYEILFNRIFYFSTIWFSILFILKYILSMTSIYSSYFYYITPSFLHEIIISKFSNTTFTISDFIFDFILIIICILVFHLLLLCTCYREYATSTYISPLQYVNSRLFQYDFKLWPLFQPLTPLGLVSFINGSVPLLSFNDTNNLPLSRVSSSSSSSSSSSVLFSDRYILKRAQKHRVILYYAFLTGLFVVLVTSILTLYRVQYLPPGVFDLFSYHGANQLNLNIQSTTIDTMTTNNISSITSPLAKTSWSEWFYLQTFLSSFFRLSHIFSLSSTPNVWYTIDCLYNNDDISTTRLATTQPTSSSSSYFHPSVTAHTFSRFNTRYFPSQQEYIQALEFSNNPKLKQFSSSSSASSSSSPSSSSSSQSSPSSSTDGNASLESTIDLSRVSQTLFKGSPRYQLYLQLNHKVSLTLAQSLNPALLYDILATHDLEHLLSHAYPQSLENGRYTTNIAALSSLGPQAEVITVSQKNLLHDHTSASDPSAVSYINTFYRNNHIIPLPLTEIITQENLDFFVENFFNENYSSIASPYHNINVNLYQILTNPAIPTHAGPYPLTTEIITKSHRVIPKHMLFDQNFNIIPLPSSLTSAVTTTPSHSILSEEIVPSLQVETISMLPAYVNPVSLYIIGVCILAVWCVRRYVLAFVSCPFVASTQQKNALQGTSSSSSFFDHITFPKTLYSTESTTPSIYILHIVVFSTLFLFAQFLWKVLFIPIVMILLHIWSYIIGYFIPSIGLQTFPIGTVKNTIVNNINSKDSNIIFFPQIIFDTITSVSHGLLHINYNDIFITSDDYSSAFDALSASMTRSSSSQPVCPPLFSPALIPISLELFPSTFFIHLFFASVVCCIPILYYTKVQKNIFLQQPLQFGYYLLPALGDVLHSQYDIEQFSSHGSAKTKSSATATGTATGTSATQVPMLSSQSSASSISPISPLSTRPSDSNTALQEFLVLVRPAPPSQRFILHHILQNICDAAFNDKLYTILNNSQLQPKPFNDKNLMSTCGAIPVVLSSQGKPTVYGDVIAYDSHAYANISLFDNSPCYQTPFYVKYFMEFLLHTSLYGVTQRIYQICNDTQQYNNITTKKTTTYNPFIPGATISPDCNVILHDIFGILPPSIPPVISQAITKKFENNTFFYYAQKALPFISYLLPRNCEDILPIQTVTSLWNKITYYWHQFWPISPKLTPNTINIDTSIDSNTTLYDNTNNTITNTNNTNLFTSNNGLSSSSSSSSIITVHSQANASWLRDFNEPICNMAVILPTVLDLLYNVLSKPCNMSVISGSSTVDFEVFSKDVRYLMTTPPTTIVFRYYLQETISQLIYLQNALHYLSIFICFDINPTIFSAYNDIIQHGTISYDTKIIEQFNIMQDNSAMYQQFIIINQWYEGLSKMDKKLEDLFQIPTIKTKIAPQVIGAILHIYTHVVNTIQQLLTAKLLREELSTFHIENSLHSSIIPLFRAHMSLITAAATTTTQTSIHHNQQQQYQQYRHNNQQFKTNASHFYPSTPLTKHKY